MLFSRRRKADLTSSCSRVGKPCSVSRCTGRSPRRRCGRRSARCGRRSARRRTRAPPAATVGTLRKNSGPGPKTVNLAKVFTLRDNVFLKGFGPFGTRGPIGEGFSLKVWGPSKVFTYGFLEFWGSQGFSSEGFWSFGAGKAPRNQGFCFKG